MAYAHDLKILQLANGPVNTVIGYDGAGVPTTYGVVVQDEIGLVPEPTAADAKKVLFGVGAWGALATSVSDNEMVRYEVDTGAFVGIELYSLTPGLLQLGNHVDTFGELHIASGISTNRKLVKKFAINALATALGVTAVASVPNNSVVIIKFIGAGVTETTSIGAEAFAGEVAGVFRVDNSGVMTQVGTKQSPVPVQEDQASGAPVMDFNIVGTNIQVVVSNAGGPVGSYRIVGFVEYVISTATP